MTTRVQRTNALPADLLSATDAAGVLGVKTSTIYTYVTRGHLTAHRRPGDRSSWFSRTEVESLRVRRNRKATSSGHRESVTAISLIADGSYWYRGYSPLQLAYESSFESVAEMLWTGTLIEDVQWDVPPPGGPDDAITAAIGLAGRPLDALRIAASALAVTDEVRLGIGLPAMVVGARRILVNLVRSLPPLSDPASATFDALVWSRLHQEPPAPSQLAALNGALVIMADHGVAPSTLAARTVASYRADPYGVVQAGLAIMAGGWHGGRALSAESMLEDVHRGKSVAEVVGERSRQGSIPALGQPRYPAGDPRYAVIVDLVTAACDGGGTVISALQELTELTGARALPPPSVEFALAAMSREFGFVTGASEAIFAIGRSAGWLAHAIEEYGTGERVSPEFRYVGVSPLER